MAGAALLLDADALSARVAGRVLWQGVRLRLHAGESMAVVGPSGVGKTVFLRTLAGLRAAADGSIRCAGRDLAVWAMPEYRARVMYLAQRPALPEGSVRAALQAPFALRVHRGRRYRAEEAARLFAELGMAADFPEQQTADLSGGQEQIAALVRALLLQPSILLLDEPTAALDAQRTHRVEQLLRDWLRTAAHACVWVSHDAGQVARVATQVLELTSS